MNYFERLINDYYFDFKEFWVPIYRKQIMNAKFDNDTETLKCIKSNILKNWYLKDYQDIILKELCIEYL